MSTKVGDFYTKESVKPYAQIIECSDARKPEQILLREQMIEIQNKYKQKGQDSFSVLDIGCGTGIYTRSWREFTKGEIRGLDISKGMLEEAQNIEKEKKQDIKYHEGNGLEDFSHIIDNKKFDVIQGIWMLLYASSKQALFDAAKAIRKSLTNDGEFVCMIYDPAKHLPKYHNVEKRPEIAKLGDSPKPANGNFDREEYEEGEEIIF
mmetsp:Transcript_22670/g.19687  ORF Transcript_22670/g.19687 Transcript_22670/m.19687 type:complete len:207 (+) Transcript_22670:40-660(+)|eukprot:CAMPEP_0114597270 /NCGR_PEP_ID=MMETSP0125-20121206/19518_1 /TAXON_ID=485358 ORGANISM="Aristerostoma sp., Strain ATCC 50986" /NCGR_SAMPLE_ID=MMETSP0125 /ASSEMBLY_ACC=CAM_ASM_000245 /LENGTH=206 /DNA_ID=CAMNT_0001801589 /DNA_START=21 /DNA_END=641 /DNA_ORIENTATION=-